MKKVSIIVPVYNTSLYLRECLNSIKNQTLKDIEVIVVDDGSTDSSPAICDEYAVSDERFKVFHNQNQGVSASRNFGIDKADSEFVILLIVTIGLRMICVRIYINLLVKITLIWLYVPILMNLL